MPKRRLNSTRSSFERSPRGGKLSRGVLSYMKPKRRLNSINEFSYMKPKRRLTQMNELSYTKPKRRLNSAGNLIVRLVCYVITGQLYKQVYKVYSQEFMKEI